MRNIIHSLFVLLLIVLGGFCWPLYADGAEYYVSSSLGKDTNSGTTADSPWKTLARISQSPFNPGDRVLLRKGDLWEESLVFSNSGSELSPITISSYGDGANPIIKGCVPITAWQSAGNGIYSCALNIQCNGFLENGVPLLKGTSPSLTDGNWYSDNTNLYYKPIGDPSSRLTERASKPNGILLTNVHDVIVDGVDTYGSNGYGIRILDCYRITIQNCKVKAHALFGIAIERSSEDGLHNMISVNHNQIEWNANGIYIIAKGGGFLSSGYDGCDLSNNSIKYSNYNNIWWHNTKDGHAIGIQNTNGSKIENNEIVSNFSGICLWTAIGYRSDNNIFARNYIADNNLYGIVQGADGGDNSGNNQWCYNIIVNNGVSGLLPGYWGGLRINKSQKLPNLFYNNTLYGNDINIYLYSSPDYHVIKNNISINPKSYHVNFLETSGKNNVVNNNLYHSNNVAQFAFGTMNNLSLEEWKSKAGQDSNSIFIDPQFVNADPKTPTDFRLRSSSPAREKAELLPSMINKDYFSNTIADSPDIGACAYGNYVETPQDFRRIAQ